MAAGASRESQWLKEAEQEFKHFLSTITFDSEPQRENTWMGRVGDRGWITLQWDDSDVSGLLRIVGMLCPRVSADGVRRAMTDLVVDMVESQFATPTLASSVETGLTSSSIQLQLSSVAARLQTTIQQLREQTHEWIAYVFLEGLVLNVDELAIGGAVIHQRDSNIEAEIDELIARAGGRERMALAVQSWERSKCYAEVRAEGDTEYALDRVLESVRDAILILNFCMKTASHTQSRIGITGCCARGHRGIPMVTPEDGAIDRTWHLSGKSINVVPFTVGPEELERMRTIGLERLNEYARASNTAVIPNRARRAVYWYGRAMDAESAEEKFLELWIGLEALLIGGGESGTYTSTGTISQKLSDRIAFLLGHDYRTRDKISRLVKDLYGTRSKIAHAGAPVDDNSLRSLNGIAFHTIVAFVHKNFESPDAFAQWEDRLRYGAKEPA